MVYLMNFIALGEVIYLISRTIQEPSRYLVGIPGSLIIWLIIFSWAFFNALNLFPWYPQHRGKLGIRLHFQKTVVPVSYLTALALALYLLGVSAFALIPFVVLFLPMYYVACILLIFNDAEGTREID